MAASGLSEAKVYGAQAAQHSQLDWPAADSGPRASADSNSGVKLVQDEWIADVSLTDAEKALVEQRLRDL